MEEGVFMNIIEIQTADGTSLSGKTGLIQCTVADEGKTNPIMTISFELTRNLGHLLSGLPSQTISFTVKPQNENHS